MLNRLRKVARAHTAELGLKVMFLKSSSTALSTTAPPLLDYFRKCRSVPLKVVKVELFLGCKNITSKITN